MGGGIWSLARGKLVFSRLIQEQAVISCVRDLVVLFLLKMPKKPVNLNGKSDRIAKDISYFVTENYRSKTLEELTSDD